MYDILCISDKPEDTMKGIQAEFKLKNYKVEEPTYYLDATVSKIQNKDGVECWAMYSNKYSESEVNNVKEVLNKKVFAYQVSAGLHFDVNSRRNKILQLS